MTGRVKTDFSLGDILANSISHGIGLFLALFGAVFLILASMRGDRWVVASCSVFAGTLVLVYLFSTLYHSLVVTRARHVFQILDHSAIYLLIAGTYTPFTLVALRGRVGWWLFGFVWTLAAAGVVFKSLLIERFAVASAVVYLLQGWGDCVRDPAAVPGDRGTWAGVAGGGWSFLQFGYCFLCFRPQAVLPCGVAFVCPGGECGPLFRCAAVHCAAKDVEFGDTQVAT